MFDLSSLTKFSRAVHLYSRPWSYIRIARYYPQWLLVHGNHSMILVTTLLMVLSGWSHLNLVASFVMVAKQ